LQAIVLVKSMSCQLKDIVLTLIESYNYE